MAVGSGNSQKSSNLVKPQTWLKISILLLVFYVEPNAGRSIDGLVADNLRVNEGDRAILPCFFLPTDAVIDTSWYWETNGTAIIRSDDPPDPNSRYLVGDATSRNVSLVIKKVLRWDKGTYTCGVNDAVHSDNCILTVNYLDNPEIKGLTNLLVLEGTGKVPLLCKPKSSYPEVNTMLTWFHDGNIIDTGDTDKYILRDNVLTIKNFDQRDEGNYSCRAENEFFVGKNGKYSNSIVFSLLKEESPPSSSRSQLWIVFIIIPVLIIGIVVLAMYFLKKRSKNTHRFDDIILETVIKKDQKNEINVERALDDLISVELIKNGYEEHLTFKDRVLTVARGECPKASFTSTYKSEHSCFKGLPGVKHEPFFTMLLRSCNWPEKGLRQLFSSDKDDSRTRRTGKFKDKGSCGSIEFSFEFKKQNGATGYIIFNDVTDDDEGHYIYSLQIKDDLMTFGVTEKIIHVFYGRTSIQVANAIYRSNVDKKQFISPIGIVLSDQLYAFALKMEKDKKEGQEEKTILRYITCTGKPQSVNNYVTITWSDVAQVLIKPEEELLSFVALPGIIHSYIFLGYINVSKNRRLLGKVFSFLPDGSFKLINNIVEKLESKGPVEILKFDPGSGKKLSNGRLVVGGWIKCGYHKRKRMDVLQSRFTGSTSSRGKLEDVENQSYEYEPFIMWTDDEINWCLGEHLKIDEAEKNMRIQVTETGNGKEVVVIISSLDSKKVLYEGQSNDYCTTFTKKTKDWYFKMPVVSFAIIDGSLVSSMEYVKETSEQQDAVTSAKKGEGSSENEMKENSPETNEPPNDGTVMSTEDPGVLCKNVKKRHVLHKAASKFTNALPFNSRESSTNPSTQNYERVPTTSINNDKSIENVMEEGSPEANQLTDDEKVSTLEKLPEDSMEGTSDNVKKRSSLSKFGRVLADRLLFSSKKASSANEQAKESENVSLTEESTFNKEKSTENTIKEGSSETNKLTDDEQVRPTAEEPHEDSMERSSEKVKKLSSIGRLAKKVTKLPTKSKKESSGSKSTKESETSEIEVASNVEGTSSQIQDRSTWKGLWHLEQDTTTTDKAIRLRPVKHDTGSSDSTYDFVTILENRSKVQCEQIVPFTCKGKSWFLIIYTTHYINDEEQSRSLCTRYHVFSLDKIMSGIQ